AKAKARSAAKPTPRKAAARKPAARKAVPRPKARVQAPKVEAQPAPPPPTPAPPPPPRKPGFYEAVAIYERGVQALQRRDFRGAADLFRSVIQRYPEEQELVERADLYLRVCER